MLSWRILKYIELSLKYIEINLKYLKIKHIIKVYISLMIPYANNRKHYTTTNSDRGIDYFRPIRRFKFNIKKQILVGHKVVIFELIH